MIVAQGVKIDHFGTKIVSGGAIQTCQRGQIEPKTSQNSDSGAEGFGVNTSSGPLSRPYILKDKLHIWRQWSSGSETQWREMTIFDLSLAPWLTRDLGVNTVNSR